MREMIGEQFGILHLGCFNKFSVNHDVQISVDLFFNSFNYFGMAMTHIGHADTTDEINIFFPMNII